jgi:hypothetical protein
MRLFGQEVGPAPRLLISDADHPHPLGPVALRLVPAARRGCKPKPQKIPSRQI